MDVMDLCDRAATRVHLGPREREVLAALLSGDTEAEIALTLSISRHTVHSHVRSLYLKLGVHNRMDLFRHFVTHSG